MIDQLTPDELSRQLMKPDGEVGLEVAKALNETNQSLYDLAWGMLDIKPKENILEIGFGNGKHFQRYFDTEPEVAVTGVDFSTDMCGEAERYNTGLIQDKKLSLYCSETLSMPLPDQSFNWIIGLNIIYFLNPPARHLRELYRVLKPGGHLLIGYRPRHSVEHLAFTKVNFTLYEPDELSQLLEMFGFDKVRDESMKININGPDGEPVELINNCLLTRKNLQDWH